MKLKFGEMIDLECPVCGNPAGRPVLAETFHNREHNGERISLDVSTGWVEKSGYCRDDGNEDKSGKPPLDGPGLSVKVECESGHHYRLALQFHKGTLFLLVGSEMVQW